jgi:hypothetical protein
MRELDGDGATHVVAIELATRDIVQDVVHLIHRHHFRVAEHSFVDGSGVYDDLDDKLANIPDIGEGRENVATAGNGTRQFAVSNIVERGRKRELEPPADVDGGVWKGEALHVVEDVFFLWDLLVCYIFDGSR